MNKEDFSLYNINCDIDDKISNQGKYDLNFCRMIVNAPDENLSVTAKYEPVESFISLADDPGKKPKEYYYGVSPRLDSNELIRCISHLELKDPTALDAYVKKHGDWFMAPGSWGKDGDFKRLKALAKYIVIVMASHFGIRIVMDPEINEAFCSRFKNEDGKAYLKGVGRIFADINDKKYSSPFLIIKGCPTDEILEFFAKYRFEKTTIESVLDNKKEKKETLEAWKAVAASAENNTSPITINEVYADHVTLISGKVFYSGVLLKPTELVYQEDSKENHMIRSLCIHFERSTYGTVCALDRNLTDHPLLGEDRSRIIGMLLEDDLAKQKLQEAYAVHAEGTSEADVKKRWENQKYVLDALNDYLKETINVNQICVSANIVTSDGCMLLGKRGSGNIDGGKLYPGVNGNAEVADRDVSFYSTSVYEDYPTIHLDDDRIDFFGEIGREAYGELKLDLPKQEWICYGLAIIGNKPVNSPGQDGNTPQSSYDEKMRRMHFTLIFEHQTDKSFQEIHKERLKAAEAFETNDYIGISVKCEKNRWTYFWKMIGKGIAGIVGHKDFVEAVVAIALFFMTLVPIIGNKEALKMSWNEYVALFLAACIVLFTIVRISRSCLWRVRHNKKTGRMRIYKTTEYDEIRGKMDESLSGLTTVCSFHPAAYACLRAYVDNAAHDAFFPKDRR